MYYFRPSQDRGQARFGWLNSRHTFSFGHYYDPKHMGFSALCVINDDTVKPGAGFDTHGHREMEIISYILEGAIEHLDSEGNHFVVPAGEVQRMSAGTGITHSEYNHSKTEHLKFLQIWIQPNRRRIKPSYEQKKISQTKNLTPLITPNGRNGSLKINQDASLFRLELGSGENIKLQTHKRPGYLHILSGAAKANGGDMLYGGDGLGLFKEQLELQATIDGIAALWFDLPAFT
ncbi:pirin family protein [Microbulbifer sp. OS29]|uniref:Pirin family protein n=1 Tax=Microbulbifer okhotskensis TaxID=2926617 RepID=A0A9X2J7C3_9GAMM|nr:pirin family protein [Microbulbifer okhotskensis]MCO1337033.1 pirin family protein [Microbulbifer okhotskensis]